VGSIEFEWQVAIFLYVLFYVCIELNNVDTLFSQLYVFIPKVNVFRKLDLMSRSVCIYIYNIFPVEICRKDEKGNSVKIHECEKYHLS
jgi:hypothetical protein